MLRTITGSPVMYVGWNILLLPSLAFLLLIIYLFLWLLLIVFETHFYPLLSLSLSLQTQDRVIMQKWITPGQTVRIDRPILFHITDIVGTSSLPAYGEPFKATGYMEHRAL